MIKQTTTTTQKERVSLSYGDSENKNLSLSVHTNGATFINLHNVDSIKQSTQTLSSGEKVKGYAIKDNKGNNTFISLFMGDKKK